MHPDDLATLADLVADRLAERLAAPTSPAEPAELIDAHEAGRRLGRSAVWARRHAEQLGAVRLGDGDRPRLAFPAEELVALAARLGSSASPEPEAPAQPAPPRRHRSRPQEPGAASVPAGLAYEGSGVPSWR